MVVLVAEAGPLRSAIAEGLRGAGHEVTRWGADDDLFDVSVGARALVYVPFDTSIDARLRPGPDPERARRVLGAAKAPGVEVVIFVLPARGYEAEEALLRRDGKPYVVVRAPLVLEELAEVLARDGSPSLWLPREGRVSVGRAEEVGRAVAEAIETEEQGGDLCVASVEMSAPELFEQASQLAGDVKVHAVRPSIYRMVRPIARWLRGGEPAALGLWDGLAGAEGAAA